MRTWVFASIALAIAVPSARAQSTPDDEQLKKLQTELAEEQAKQAFAAAVKTASKLVELETKIHGKDSPEVYAARQRLAGLYSIWGDDAEASKIYLQLVTQAERQHGANSEEVARALQIASTALSAQGKFDEIDPIEQRIVAVTKKLQC